MATAAAPVRSRVRADVVVLSLAIAAGAAIRFATLGHQSLDEDETVSVWLMHHSLAGLLRDIAHTESTPPLFYVLEWVWTRVVGTGAAGMRSLSALMGVATIPVAWLAARQLGGRRAGTIAGVLVALSPALVWYSQEARAYALLILLSAASLYFLARASEDRRALAWWTLCAGAAMATHYFAVFLVAAEAAWLILAAVRGSIRRTDPGGAAVPRRTDVVRALALLVGVGLALAPLALRQSSNGGSAWIGEIPLWGRLTDVPPQVMLGEGRPLLPWSFATAVAIPLIVASLWVLVRGPRRRNVLLPWSVGLAGVGLPVLLDLAGKHIVLDRNMLGAGVVMLIGAAVAMGSPRLRRIGVAAAAIVALLFAWDLEMGVTNPRMQREPWRAAAAGLGHAAVARAVVFGPNVSDPWPAPELITFQAVYLPSMLTFPDRGANVREIDELDVRDDLSDTDPRPDPVSPGRGWHLVARAGDQTWTLYRYQSRQAHFFKPDQLFAKNLLSNRDSGDQLIGLQLPAVRR